MAVSKYPKKSTGRSADASAGAVVAKKATAKARATGQTKSSAMDAASRRYKPESTLYKDLKGNTRLSTTVKDKKTNRNTFDSKGIKEYNRTIKKSGK